MFGYGFTTICVQFKTIIFKADVLHSKNMKKLLCYAILLSLVLINCSICGCIGDYNTQPSTSNPKYQEGDIISFNDTHPLGLLIIKYIAINNSYFSRPIGKFDNGSWGYCVRLAPEGEYDRIDVENLLLFKADHVSNLNAIPILKTRFAVEPVTEENIRLILLENEKPKIQNLDIINVNDKSIEITQHYSNYWLAYTFLYTH